MSDIEKLSSRVMNSPNIPRQDFQVFSTKAQSKLVNILIEHKEQIFLNTVIYKFQAPDDGKYSFQIGDYKV